MATKKNARKSSTKSKKTARKNPTPLKTVKRHKKHYLRVASIGQQVALKPRAEG
jgi:hypothetical protein